VKERHLKAALGEQTALMETFNQPPAKPLALAAE
jgi:hypothetical protein